MCSRGGVAVARAWFARGTAGKWNSCEEERVGPVQVCVLGSLKVITSSGAIQISAAQQRTVIATLAMRPGDPVPPGTLAEALWGEVPSDKWQVALRGLVRRLRSALGDDRDRLGKRSGGYLLEAGPDDVDAPAFQALLARGQALLRDGEWELACNTLAKAEALWRGAPFSDIPSDWLYSKYVPYLEESLARARTARLEAGVRLSLRSAADSVPELRRLADMYPERENPRLLLMLALYRAGRYREAMETYRQWWNHLRDEAGADPGPAIRSLRERIARQDETLLAGPLGYDMLP